MSQFGVGIGSKTTAAVCGDGLMCSTEQIGHTETEDPRLELPERVVNSRNSHGADSCPSEIANCPDHFGPESADIQAIGPDDGALKMRVNHICCRDVREGISKCQLCRTLRPAQARELFRSKPACRPIPASRSEQYTLILPATPASA